MDGWMMSICDFFLLRVKGMGYLGNRVIYQRYTGCDFPVVPPPTNSDLFRRLFQRVLTLLRTPRAESSGFTCDFQKNICDFLNFICETKHLISERRSRSNVHLRVRHGTYEWPFLFANPSAMLAFKPTAPTSAWTFPQHSNSIYQWELPAIPHAHSNPLRSTYPLPLRNHPAPAHRAPPTNNPTPLSRSQKKKRPGQNRISPSKQEHHQIDAPDSRTYCILSRTPVRRRQRDRYAVWR